MLNKSPLKLAIQDESGNVVHGATVTVRSEFTGALATTAVRRDGAPRGNPFTAEDGGDLDCYLQGGRYRIDAVSGAFSRTWRDVQVGTLQAADAITPWSPQGDWSSEVVYSTGAFVQHNSANYVSNVDDNENNEPPVDGSPPEPTSDEFWTFVPVPGFPDVLATAIVDPEHGDILRYDSGASKWINKSLKGWHEVAVVGNEATIDIDDGDKFAIIVDDDCEIQVPANAVAGAPFAIRVLMDGNHAVTFGTGWLGTTPSVLQASGDETVLSGIVLEESPTTAVVNAVKSIPAV